MTLIRSFCLAICCLVTAGAFAQEGENWKPASKESQAYNEYRNFTSTPPYGAKKIAALLKTLEIDENEVEALKQRDYMALSLREKFTYIMLHGESYSQNCDIQPPIQDEHKKIFGQLPEVFGEHNWSERQIQFMRTNKDSLIAWIKDCVAREKRLGLNLKHAIVISNAR